MCCFLFFYPLILCNYIYLCYCYADNSVKIRGGIVDRIVFEDLLGWKNRKEKMPLILTGARQVGKTWLMKEFGKRYFKNVAYVSFDSNPKINETLETTLSPTELLLILQSETKTPITRDTLILFDEIQESPRALLSLKYFCEDAPEYSVMAAGRPQ